MPVPFPDYEGEITRIARRNMADVVPLIEERDEETLRKIELKENPSG